MADYTQGSDTGTPRVISDAEAQKVAEVLRFFSEISSWRNTTASHWEEVAELIDPPSRNTFMYGSTNTQGEKKTDRQIDASGALALERFAAICDSLLTPRNMLWHGLEASDDYVMKDRATRLWFADTTRKLFKYRYAPHANFASQNYADYRNLGAYGNAGMFIDDFDGGKGVRYRSMPVGEMFFIENHQGLVIGFIRWFRLTAFQTMQKWGKERFPETMRPALEQSSQQLYDFLHYVMPRGADYDAERLDAKGKKWESCYVCMGARCLMSEGGYNTFPAAISRYVQTPGEVYGRSPAMMVLPALKTLNAQKRTFLKQGHRASDPVLLTADDGLLSGVSLRPGALNKGGMTADGKPLVGVLPTGSIQTNKEMMDEEKALIHDAFLVSVFQILQETPQMTATEVIERTNEKGILLAPTMGRQQSERLGPLIDRELDVLSRQGILAPMPPRLKEAQGEYHVVYSSPLSRAMRAQEAAGFMRTVESTKELVAITGDTSLLDPFDFDTATTAIADINGVPADWMADDAMITNKRKMRQAQLQKQQTIQAAPAQAAIMKAQAVQAKAGVAPQQGQQQQPPQPGLGQ